jgi:hypothetical protein
VLFWDLSKYNLFLLQLSVSNCLFTHCTIFFTHLPIGKKTWNCVFLNETGGKLRLCLGKWYETEYFLVKPVENQDYVWNLRWNQLSWNNVYLSIWNGYNLKNFDLWPLAKNFQLKNDLKINFWMVLFQDSLVLSQIVNTEISNHILSDLISFLYWFCDLTRPCCKASRLKWKFLQAFLRLFCNKVILLVERQLIKVATHQNGNSSKRQLIKCPLEVWGGSKQVRWGGKGTKLGEGESDWALSKG